MQKGRGANETPLPRKTPYGAQVALQHCLILHMGKRRIILHGENLSCQLFPGPLHRCFFAVMVFSFGREDVALSPEFPVVPLTACAVF